MLVSFCHNYRESEISSKISQSISHKSVPSLVDVQISQGQLKPKTIYSLEYPRLIKDFEDLRSGFNVLGEMPLPNAEEFFQYRLPRYGVMGLSRVDDNSVVAATWNGFYLLDSNNSYKARAFLTNRFVNDPHGIDTKIIVFILLVPH